MSLGAIVTGALPLMRTQAESLMLDTCTITAPGGEPVWDDEAGEYVTPPGIVVYQGRCQVPSTHPNAQDADAGETNWAKGMVSLRLPARPLEGDVGDPLAVADGHTVEVTTRPGLFMDVRYVIPQTIEKSRKVSCEVVTRDA